MEKIQLKDVLDVKRGASLSGEYYSTSGKLIRLTLGNFNYPDCGWKENKSKDDIYFTGPVRKEFILQEGDIITPLTEQVRGLLGNTATIPESNKYIQSGDIGLIIPNEEKIDKRYSYYLISSTVVKKQLDAGSQQTKIRHTSPDSIKNCYAYILERKEQVKVACLLDSINKKIEINNSINDNLQQLARTIYEQYFLQYSFTNEELTENKDLSRKKPKCWEVAKAKQCLQIVLGGTPDTSVKDYWNGSINWLNSGEIANFPIVDSELKITQKGIDNSATKLMPKFTTLVSITGNIRASITAIETCANQSVVGIIQNDKFHASYIFPVVCDLLKHFTNISGGNCQKHINKGTIENMFILVPPKNVLEEYYEKVDSYFEKMYKTALENKKLIDLRDELLPLLMNGQVSIA